MHDSWCYYQTQSILCEASIPSELSGKHAVSQIFVVVVNLYFHTVVKYL